METEKFPNMFLHPIKTKGNPLEYANNITMHLLHVLYMWIVTFLICACTCNLIPFIVRLCELCKFKVQSSEEKGNLPLKEKENFASMAMALTACFWPLFFGISRRCLPKQLKLLIYESEYEGKFLIFHTAMYFVRKKWAVGISFLAMSKRSFSALCKRIRLEEEYKPRWSCKFGSYLNSAVRLLKVIYPTCRCFSPVKCP